jgi:exonuclease III
MSANHLLNWNVRGLNSRAHRNAVRDVTFEHRASIVCLQETKVDVISNSLTNDLMGSDYDYAFLPAVGAAGGVASCWRRDLWSGANLSVRSFSVTVSLSPLGGGG